MTFNEEKYQLKYCGKDKIISTIFYYESKGNKINTRKFLGKKRKLFESKKNNNPNLKISRPTIVFIKRTINQNSEVRETCAICLNKISFENKHILHCGHIFHCLCIIYWINNGSNVCPICRGNIKCLNAYSPIRNNNRIERNNNRIERNNNRIERNNNRIERNSSILINKNIYIGLKYLIYSIIFFYGLYLLRKYGKFQIGMIAAYIWLFLLFI